MKHLVTLLRFTFAASEGPEETWLWLFIGGAAHRLPVTRPYFAASFRDAWSSLSLTAS